MVSRHVVGGALILGIILVALAPLALMQGGGFEKPVLIPDQEAALHSFVDMWSTGLTDDGENLTLIVMLGAPLPTWFYGVPDESSLTMEHEVDLEIEVWIDLDNDVSTGIHVSELSSHGGGAMSPQASALVRGATWSGSVEGIDAVLYITYYHSNSMYEVGESFECFAWFYYPNGTAAGAYNPTTPTYTVEGPLLKIPLNLTEITIHYNEATGRSISVPGSLKAYIFPWIRTYIADHIPLRNVTVPEANITVDGDPSDWAGIQPVLVDELDPISLGDLGDLNITALYLATNGTHLFIRADIAAPPADYGDIYMEGSPTIHIYFDDDGNGSFDDYYIGLRRGTNNVDIGYDGTAGSCDLSGGCYNAWSSTTYEAAVNITKLSSMSNFNQNFTLNVSAAGNRLPVKAVLTSEIYDDPPTPSPYDAYGITEYPFIYYVMGLGGRLGSSVEAELSGYNELSFGNATITINTTGTVNVILSVYPGDPMGGDGLEEAPIPYHYFNITPLSNVEWPIIINITYDETGLGGIDENTLTPYYYDKNAGSYKPVPENLYTVDTQANTVTITMTQELYMAGDPVIVLGPPPPAGVGGILLQRGGDTTNILATVAMAAALGAAILVYAWTGRK